MKRNTKLSGVFYFIMIGIYKITNPKGKIYIGQSRNIENRFRSYMQKSQCKSQVKLKRSFNKYGIENHKFEIIELCDFNLLNKRERFWQDYYNVLENGLNCVLQSSDEKTRVHSEETRLKISEAKKGKVGTMKGRKHTEDAKLKMSIKSKGRILPKEWADKARLNLEKSRGRKSTPESIEKRRQTIKANGGYKTTEETKEKIRKANTGLKRSDEVKKKISIAMKNRVPFSDEWRRNIGAKSKGRVFSEESKLKISRNSSRNSSKIVLHLKTGIYFDSAKDASKCFNFKHSTFKSMLNGSIKTNRTQCIYA